MLRGGVADKLGNDYEAHWTLIEALRVLQGYADEIRLEAFNEDAAGFEFRVTTSNQNVWHQCKRRRANGTWTIQALASEGVLAAFARKLANAQNECVFVSSDPAAAFKVLIEKARLVGTAADYVASLSSADIEGSKQLGSVWHENAEITYDWLRRCRVETVSDYSLHREARAVCGLNFRADPNIAIERLASFLDTKLTQTLRTAEFRAAIDSLDLGWKARLDETLDGKFFRATDEYLQSLPPPIAGAVIQTADIDEAVKMAVSGSTRLLVVAGAAGSGKSVAMSRIVAAGSALGWPTLALRIDRFLSAQTIEEVGKALLGREESPVGVLGNRHGHRETLLVIDQVDAISEASGRSGRIRDQLFQMIGDSHFFPHMRVVVACRSYDLEHDSRLKQLAGSPYTQSVTLKPLDWDVAVQPILARLGLGARQFSERERRMLAMPINLQMFANLSELGETVEGELSGSRLFDQLLGFRAREFRQAGIAWTPHAALGAMAQSMSKNQELIVPASVLASYPGGVDALGSAGLITAVGGKLQFAHESFFDHIFSLHFVGTGTSVHDLLLSDEQRLFRRTQVRQIFSRLRDQGIDRRYLTNLSEVMNATDVRFLVKDAVAYWLRSVDEPANAERAIVEKWYESGHPNEMLARTVFSGSGWLPILLKSGLINRWIERGSDAKRFGLWLLQENAAEYADLVESFLRAWWGGSEERFLELVDWFARLYPKGPIGPLEDLYRDIIAEYPAEKLDPEHFDGSFDLGSWVHNDKKLGARVLGLWLARWMIVFPESHPFGAHASRDSEHWIKELAEKDPAALLDAMLPWFGESLRREETLLQSARIRYPTIRVPLSEHNTGAVWSLTQAFETLARTDPVKVATFLDMLPQVGEPALLMHLRAIAANGQALATRLPAVTARHGVFDIGDSGDQWLAFASAAKAAFPFLSENERQVIEAAVSSHHPELDWAKKHLGRVKDGPASSDLADPDGYIRLLLTLSGQNERAILKTIGDEQLSPWARARLAELDRKFVGKPLPEAHGVRVGWVRSPIDQKAAARMADRHWLSAMARYSQDTRHNFRDFVGGASQLASVLQSRAKEDPPRFVALLEKIPQTYNAAYAESILGGVRDGASDGPLSARAIKATTRWPDADFRRAINWTVQKYPSAAKDPEVLAMVLTSAEFGTASDTAVKTTNANQGPRKSVSELLESDGDFASSGMNGERGSAFEGLAAVLWDDANTLSAVAALVERQVEAEALTSVRMMMLHTINSIAKHDTALGLGLLERLAKKDPIALQCHTGHHILNWATYNELFDAAGISRLLVASPEPAQRTLGLLMQSGLALCDDTSAAEFSACFADDPLCRQVAGYRANGNVTSDRVGERAAAWLTILLDDEDKEVRHEASQAHWSEILDGSTDRASLVMAHIASRSFEEHSDSLMRALEDRVDRFPDITFAAISRLVELVDGWQKNDRHGHYTTLHHLPRMLVELYRAVDGESARERELLGLFDKYLAHEIGNMRTEIGTYERH
ncbi:hypothetical protein [Mesorhizobium sp. M0870]|uniref:hypothetical protein n=1 Tax=Mesorhizobium sp. M0870 TaxID=2957016 RepID=UPI00333C30B6